MDFKANLSHLIAELRILLDDYKIDKAFEIVQKIRNDQEMSSNLTKSDETLLFEIERLYNETVFLSNQMEFEDNWIIEKASSTVTIKYKKIENTRFYTLKLEAILDFSIFNLCALIYEIELFKEWMPFCDESSCVSRPGKAFKIAHIALNIPFIKKRDTFIKGHAVNRLQENGTILILSGSIDEDAAFLEKYNISLPQEKSNVRLKVTNCAMEIRPITREKFEARIICSCDPKIDYIPEFIVNFCARKGSVYMFEKMMKMAKNMKGTQWEKNMSDPKNREFYSWTEKALDDYFTSKKL